MTALDDSTASFPFRSWVRSTCRRAMFWGVGVVAILGGVTWLFREPESRALGRAFGVLLLYSVLFFGTLFKIWWTASRAPAVLLGEELLAYQSLHRFRPNSFPIEEIVSCGMRSGTDSMRFVRVKPSGKELEFYLNLAVIDGRNEFIHRLGKRLEAGGLERMTERPKRWIKPGYEERFWGAQT